MNDNKIMFWGYFHSIGTIQVKRWFGDHKDYTEDCIDNPFCLKVVKPFEAKNSEEAYMIIERELNGSIMGQS
jgi:hypothetical protein